MRILYLHQYFATPDFAAGTRSYEMARRLVAAGHQVTLLTTTTGLDASWAPSRGWHRHEVDGIELEILHVPYTNYMSFRQRVWAFFRFAWYASWRARKGAPDVVFATSTPLTIAIPALAAKIWHRVPMVFEVRDLWPEIPIAVGALTNPVAKVMARWLEWVAYHGAAHVVALSPGVAQAVIKRGISPDRVTVIPNSCDMDMFDVPSEQGAGIRERLGLEIDQPLIVYTGKFGRVNAMEYLVEVAAVARTLSPTMRFLLIGDGVKKPETVALAQEKGVLGQNLFIWDPICKKEIVNVLAAATVATSTTVNVEAMWNNSANKFFDALAAGTPTAINYGGWQADLLNETGAGIMLPPDDPAEGARYLAEFVQDGPRLKAAGETARHLARTRFNRDDMARQLETILRTVGTGD